MLTFTSSYLPTISKSIRHGQVLPLARCRQRPLWCAVTRFPSPSFEKLDTDAFFSKLQIAQSAMCKQIEEFDGGDARFCSDAWSRVSDGSHGLTRVLQGGRTLEKGGVNTSLVQGILSKERAAAMRSRGRDCDEGLPYRAAALSFVLHFQSPFLP